MLREVDFKHYADSYAAARGNELARGTTFHETPYAALRALVPLAEMRAKGTFFTSASMASQMWEGVLGTLESGSVVVDPACGAGDLLYPALLHAQENDLEILLRGADIDPNFAKITDRRLQMETSGGGIRAKAIVADFLQSTESVRDATHVVMNPPFINMKSDESWASGNVNAAAKFVTLALNAMRDGSRLVAILPDVLRSGSRYAAWRDEVQALGSLQRVQVLGQFDTSTDVHVFVLEMLAGDESQGIEWSPEAAGIVLDDHCEIRVGPVVPHRDKEIGPVLEFVTARSLAKEQRLKRRYAGRLEQGPLILVNRTSRPGESPRIRARIWHSDELLAVENHLLIVKMRPRSKSTLEDALRILRDPRSATFLDERIRCRHLTVRALKEIPWVVPNEK